MRSMTSLLALCLALLGSVFHSSAVHAAFDISERRIYYYAHERSASVTITNSGDEEREYVINTHGWDDRTKELAPKLIAYPPVFQLQPGDQQKVRLLLRNRSGFEAPLFFRFVIREVVMDEAEQPNGLNIPISMSFPLYYVDKSVKPEARFERVAAPEGHRILVTNTSNTLVEVRSVTSADGQKAKLLKHLLPGRQEIFEFLHWSPPFEFHIRNGDRVSVD